MGHKFKGYAKHVQRSFEEDETCTDIPTYSWCLRFVIEHMPHCSDKPSAERKWMLFETAKSVRAKGPAS